MKVWKRVGAWMRALVERKRMEREMDAELRFHVEARAEDLVRGGMEPEEARRQAAMEFGGVERTKEECRDARGGNFVDGLVQDLRYGVRMLRKSPGFTAVALLTLALGIGANTAIFSLINALMLRTVPARDPEPLVNLLPRYPGEPAFNGFSWDAYQIMRDHNHVLSDLIVDSPDSFVVRWQAMEPQTILGGYLSGKFFETLGLRPAIGRLIGSEGDDLSPPSPVAVVSWSDWKGKFNLDPA